MPARKPWRGRPASPNATRNPTYRQVQKQLESVPPMPEAVAALPETLRIQAAEAWAAAHRLRVALDVASGWFASLHFDRDGGDPGVVLRCLDTAHQSLRVLAGRVSSPPFDRSTAEELSAHLPPMPSGDLGGTRHRWDSASQRLVEYHQPRWQDDPALWEAWYGPGGRSEKSNILCGHTLQLVKALTRYPATVLTPARSGAPKPTAGRSVGGRTPDERLWNVIMPRVAELREKGESWAKVRGTINREFGTSYAPGTLDRHFRTHKRRHGG